MAEAKTCSIAVGKDFSVMDFGVMQNVGLTTDFIVLPIEKVA